MPDIDDAKDLIGLRGVLAAHGCDCDGSATCELCACGFDGPDHHAHVAQTVIESDWFAARLADERQQALSRLRNRVNAAVRLVQPDDLTPLGARQIGKALEADD